MGSVRPPVIDRSESGEPARDALDASILRLVLEGRSNKEIAAALDLRVATVSTRLSRIYRRAGVSSRAQLILHLLKPPQSG